MEMGLQFSIDMHRIGLLSTPTIYIVYSFNALMKKVHSLALEMHDEK